MEFENLKYVIQHSIHFFFSFKNSKSVIPSSIEFFELRYLSFLIKTSIKIEFFIQN